MKLRRGDVIRVNWIDAGGTGGWKDVNSFLPPNIISVGHYLKTDRTGIYFAEGFDKNDKDDTLVLKLSFVPKGCIKRISKLRG